MSADHDKLTGDRAEAQQLPQFAAPAHGIDLRIRGRSVALSRLLVPPTGVRRWLAILGPGLVAAMAGDDAGGIATYSQVGAAYGYDLLWMLLLITISLAVVQEMSARLGAATGRGLLDLIRHRFGIGWTVCMLAMLLIANGGLVVTEFVGIGAAAELFGVSKYLAVPAAAVLVWYLIIGGSYRAVEKVFIAMTLVFLAYPVAAVLAHPDWGAVARGAFIPTIRPEANFVLLFVGTIGTTLTPYMQLFEQSSIVEKGVSRHHYGEERVDAYSGAIFSNIIAACIIIATAATLHVAGKTVIQTAADAAQALQPVAGLAATTLFGVGLLGASLLAAAILPLATAYSLSEALGKRGGVNLDMRQAGFFLTVFSLLIVLGAAAALIPGLPLIALLIGVQVLNGVLLPLILFFLLILINDSHVAGQLKNRWPTKLLGWGSFTLITIAVLILLGTQALSLVGIQLFPG